MQQKKLRDKKITHLNNRVLDKEKLQKYEGGPSDKIGVRGRRITPRDPGAMPFGYIGKPGEEQYNNVSDHVNSGTVTPLGKVVPIEEFGKNWPHPYYLKDGHIMKAAEGPDGEPEVIARRIEIAEIHLDIDTGKVNLLFSFDYQGQSRTAELSRGVLTKQKITQLLELGADVTDHKIRDLLVFLNRQEETAPLVNTHTRVGWGVHNGQLIYKHAKAIGIESTYTGNLKIEPEGTFTGWRATVLEHAMGHPPLELALSLGLSAAVLPLVAEETGLEALLVHMYGNSTQGKTTAVRLAVSPFGYPHTSGGGLLKTWNGTANAVLGHLRHNYGIPIGLEEASLRSGQDFTGFIYQLAQGRDRDRLNRSAELRETAEWSTTVISNAEHSLTGKSKQNVGLQMRLIEIGNVTWTKSAESAEALTAALMKNYGTAGPTFVHHLARLGPEVVLRKWDQWRETCHRRMDTGDPLTHRKANKLAVIMATADIARDALGLDFNTDAILELLVSAEGETAGSRDIGENAYLYFLESFERHKKKFSGEHVDGGSIEAWGKCVRKGGRITEIYILPEIFKKLMAEGGFEDPSVILHEWKAKGLLDHDKDKTTRRKVIQEGGNRVFVHCVRVRKDMAPDDTGEIRPRPRKIAPRPEVGELFGDGCQ